MTNEEPNAVDHTGAPLSEIDILRSEIKTLEACLRGVQGIIFEDGYEVNVADLKARVTALEGQQRTKGTVEVCQRYVFHDCVNHRGHLNWKYGYKKCTYGTCPRQKAEESSS